MKDTFPGSFRQYSAIPSFVLTILAALVPIKTYAQSDSIWTPRICLIEGRTELPTISAPPTPDVLAAQMWPVRPPGYYPLVVRMPVGTSEESGNPYGDFVRDVTIDKAFEIGGKKYLGEVVAEPTITWFAKNTVMWTVRGINPSDFWPGKWIWGEAAKEAAHEGASWGARALGYVGLGAEFLGGTIGSSVFFIVDSVSTASPDIDECRQGCGQPFRPTPTSTGQPGAVAGDGGGWDGGTISVQIPINGGGYFGAPTGAGSSLTGTIDVQDGTPPPPWVDTTGPTPLPPSPTPGPQPPEPIQQPVTDPCEGSSDPFCCHFPDDDSCSDDFEASSLSNPSRHHQGVRADVLRRGQELCRAKPKAGSTTIGYFWQGRPAALKMSCKMH